MSKSNRALVSDVMDGLKVGLGHFVLREFKARYPKNYLDEIGYALESNAYSPPKFADAKAAFEEVDTQGWLNIMIRRWNDVFRAKLGHAERSYASELLEHRNDWAHQGAFTNEQAHRVADTATLLLQAINATKPAEYTQKIARHLLRQRFDNEQKKAQKNATKSVPTEESTPKTQKGLLPWRRVVKPHPDVANGRYIQAEFTADLAQVVKGEADPEYGDPKEFFQRTYLTQGLVSLLANGLKRLNGLDGDPVIQLQTAFGGGKTHSMLALHHLLSGAIGVSEIPGGEKIREQASEVKEDRIKANQAVIVGTAFDATTPRQYEDVTTHTLWGDIAYQLGGADGYKMVAQADLSGVSPGSDTLVKLLESHGPALIIIDELVAFARNLYNTSGQPAGTFDSLMTFAQSLTEAVRRSSDSVLLISLPESEIEVGGEGGKAALEILSNTIGRMETVWKPVTADESFEIVRRRLFSSEIEHADRDATLSAFRKMYADNKSDYPAGVAEQAYQQKLLAAYPIHPELFDRLYRDWSTLERFQRTRGVLRLMAAVIYELWSNGDQSLLIMPGSIPLHPGRVRNEILKYLPDNWSAILDRDVDGDNAHPFSIDRDVTTLGEHSASQRVARALFMGSAPSVVEQRVRGVEVVRIHLGIAQPGEPLAVFGDALRRMSNQLTYLYTDGGRYWYDTRPTVNRIAQERAQLIPQADVHHELIKRLKAIRMDKQDFSAAHVAPTSTADINDEARARIVVLSPQYVYRRRQNDTPAIQFVQNILESRGTAPRLYRNMLLFIVPDGEVMIGLEKATRDYLAWLSIKDEVDTLNLDPQQQKQVRTHLARVNETVDSQLQEAYQWLLAPEQPEPTGPIIWTQHRISGEGSFYTRAARKAQQDELIIKRWGPMMLHRELHPLLWPAEKPHLSIKQLWEYLACYCYLPRLYDQEVLLNSIQDGVGSTDPPFAYADDVDENGIYHGLALYSLPELYMNKRSLLVRPEVALKQIEQAQATKQQTVQQQAQGLDIAPPDRASMSLENAISNAHPLRESVSSVKVHKKRYHGTVTLDPQRVNREIGVIVEEILEHFTTQEGVKVNVTLEIEAHSLVGFEDGVIRTVSENSNTLKFEVSDFEEF